MTLDDARKDIEEIIGGMVCPKQFRCASSGFERVCKAEDIGLEAHLRCREPSGSRCCFAFSYEGARYCECPLRVYLSKTLSM
jgi:hypothetical protein